jgi:hypothetical protein
MLDVLERRHDERLHQRIRNPPEGEDGEHAIRVRAFLGDLLDAS